MSEWTHAICGPCYAKHEPGRDPVRIVEKFRKDEKCCFCGQVNRDGIFYRFDPSKLDCEHEE